MWLAIEVLSALYIISFAWFWSLCRISVPDKLESEHEPHKATLIPFERGLVLQMRQPGEGDTQPAGNTTAAQNT